MSQRPLLAPRRGPFADDPAGVLAGLAALVMGAVFVRVVEVFMLPTPLVITRAATDFFAIGVAGAGVVTGATTAAGTGVGVVAGCAGVIFFAGMMVVSFGWSCGRRRRARSPVA